MLQETSWAELQVLCKEPDQKTIREDLCRQVCRFFDRTFDFAPQPRVICIFDNQDHEFLKQEFGGKANRGIHWPIKGQGITFWPGYTHDLIAPPDGTGNVQWPFTSVIYLHGSTCATDIGLTMTFAHELQHFEQYVYRKPIWAANTLLMNLQNAGFRFWWDFPIEIEARYTAKRVAESLFGEEPVRKFVTQKINERVTETDAEDWKYIREIDTAMPYDLMKETSALVKKHRVQLNVLLENRKGDRDFASLDLDTFG